MFFSVHSRFWGSSMKATRREDGVVLIEFALVLIPLLLLTVGFLQFGLAMNAKIDATHLTAEGARYVVVNQNPGLTEPGLSPKTMQNYIRSRGDTDALRQEAVVCISYPTNSETSTSGTVGDPVKVTLTYDHDMLPGVGNLLDPPKTTLNVRSEATMRLEALPVKVPAGCTT